MQQETLAHVGEGGRDEMPARERGRGSNRVPRDISCMRRGWSLLWKTIASWCNPSPECLEPSLSSWVASPGSDRPAGQGAFHYRVY